LPAFLVALLLTALPVLAGVGGALIFPYASWHGIPVAGPAACALALVMPVASWMADTQGEPAGRSRRLRAALALAGGLALAAIGFVLVAPLAVRAGAPAAQLSVVPPRQGSTTLVTGERGFRQPGTTTRAVRSALADGPAGFLVDLADGRRRAFLAPEVQWARWDAKGTKLVVLDNAGPLGSIGKARLRFLDATGKELWPAVDEPEDLAVGEAIWAGDRLIVGYRGLETTTARVDVLDPATAGQVTVLDDVPAFTTLEEARDGRVFLYTLEVPRSAKAPIKKEDWEKATWMLRELDPVNGRLSAPLLQGHGLAFGLRGLSPSGRFWKHRTRSSSEVFETANGTSHPLALRIEPEWLRDDSLVWLERGEPGWTLSRMVPGAAPQVWARGPGRNVLLKVSPDGAFAAIVLAGPDALKEGPVLLLETGSAAPPHTLAHLAPSRFDSVEWAGPRTLAVERLGRLAFYDVTTGKSTVVFGGS
jgi:hypothetical protein